jgi:hypothetical protein
MSEFHSELDELERAHQEGQFASEEEYQKRRSELIEYYNDKLIEFSDLYSTAIVDDVRVVDDAWSTKFGNVISNTGTFKETVEGYIEEVTAEWDKYNKEVDEIKTSLNFDYDLSGMSEGVDKVAEAN